MPVSEQAIQYVHGFIVSDSEPELIQSDNIWVVTNPGGEDYTHTTDQRFWSVRFTLPFKIESHLGGGRWTCTFMHEWAINDVVTNVTSNVSGSFSLDLSNAVTAFVSEDDEAPELAAEYTNYTPDEPFFYNNHWNVVMEDSPFRVYESGQIWFSENEGHEYELVNHLRSDLFGSENAYRIHWCEDEEPETYQPEYYDEGYEDDNYSEEREEFDAREVAPVIATNIGRNVPFVSFEQEFSGNGELVARKLYEEGFSSLRHVSGYHGSEGRYERDNGSSNFCYVETDSSCGYEIIFDRMQLNQRVQAEKISTIQTILKNLKDDGHIKLSARCGFHVHVDVSDWGMKEIVSGYHLWNYLEDPIFRFSSAFWNTHRDEEVGGGYSTPVPKGHTSRRDIGRTLHSRRDALNFSPILNARGNCGCSAALYEDWANCTCNVRQPTLEFRVFNATLNQRKIRAYLAFCVAFVNLAKSFEFEPVGYQEMRWRGTNNKSGIGEKSWEDCSLERIRFILEKFPLTNAEKTDISYCLRNSSLESVMELL